MQTVDWPALARQIKAWGTELGLQKTGITDTDLSQAERYLQRWLTLGRQANMHYMGKHGHKRTRPADLIPDTMTIISARLDYWPGSAVQADILLKNPEQAYVARYALGRDYHKLLRQKLKTLANKIEAEVGEYGYRVFCDSAPVMERAIAAKAGLGWIGKHTNLLARDAGSWFFLGEIYTDLPLPTDAAVDDHCGSCISCIEACPTGAIVGPWELDAKRCISYWTIEHHGSIPEEWRPRLGNRIFGCDDCQLVCPWNRFATPTSEKDFSPRNKLDNSSLLALFAWDEETFLERTQGSAIRRLGHERWLRNIAVALGNAPPSEEIVQALKQRHFDPSALVREHVDWALKQQAMKSTR